MLKSVEIMVNLWAIATVLVIVVVPILLIRDRVRRGYSKKHIIKYSTILAAAMVFCFFIVIVQKVKINDHVDIVKNKAYEMELKEYDFNINDLINKGTVGYGQ